MALKNPGDADAYPPILIPSALDAGQFQDDFQNHAFWAVIRSTALIVALGTTFISMLFGVSAAYGIVRTGNQKRLGMTILFSRIRSSSHLSDPPGSSSWQGLRLANTYTALIATHLVTSVLHWSSGS